MTITARHCAHNDRRRIRDLERQVDRLVLSLARYGIHESDCARRALYQGDAITGLDSALDSHITCTCGLRSMIETRGEEG